MGAMPAIPDLFGTEPSPAEIAFSPDEIRAASLNARLCRAISVALKSCGKSREDVAEAMSSYLGVRISVDMLNAYSSAARETHVISWPRLIALVHATGDLRLLTAGLDQFGVALIDRRYLPYVELGILEEEKAELSRKQAQLRRATKRGGR